MILPVTLVGLAVWLLLPPSGLQRLAPEHEGRRSRRTVVVGAAAALLGAAGMLFGFGPACLGGAVGLLMAVLGWLVLRGRQRRRASRVSVQVAAACQLMAGQLRVGRFPAHALRLAAQDCVPLQLAADQDRVGADLPKALRAASMTPGATGLHQLAGAWQLSVRTGAPLAGAVARVAEQLREHELLREEVGTELAASRATGKMLALLPVVGIVMAATVGAEPVHFLTRTLIGQLCLAGALVLTAAGLVWTEILADRASPERSGHARFVARERT